LVTVIAAEIIQTLHLTQVLVVVVLAVLAVSAATETLLLAVLDEQVPLRALL
jgi:hypothetical protein